MNDAVKFWLIEAIIDGTRCDISGLIPIYIWANTTIR